MLGLDILLLALVVPLNWPQQEPAGPARGKPRQYEYDTVALNPDVQVPAGFRGEVHPLLAGETRLDLRARWAPQLKEIFRSGIKLGKVDTASVPEYSIPDELVALVRESTVAREQASYGARDFSVFLPSELGEVGQMWSIDPARVVPFLEQIHPRPATSFDRYAQPYGRRPGPPGAFGILRALSHDRLELLFRVHAEFVLREGAVLYTPACFLGRLQVDRATGTVDCFEMHVPTERPVNVNITITFPHPQRPRKEVSNIVFEHVDPMVLEGGDGALLERDDWQAALDLDQAHHRLKSAFYRFMDIDWVPTEKAVEIARELRRPILAVVLTSPLDDQSC
jgi:hypothetical protein